MGFESLIVANSLFTATAIVKAALVHVLCNFCQLPTYHTSTVNKQEHPGLNSLDYLGEKHFPDLNLLKKTKRNEYNIQ